MGKSKTGTGTVTETTIGTYTVHEQQLILGEMLVKNDTELTEYIENKVDENPALEKKVDDEHGDSDNDNNSGIDDGPDSGDMVGDGDSQDEPTEESGIEDRDLPEGYPVYGDDDDNDSMYGDTPMYNGNNVSPDDEVYTRTPVSEKTLAEFLNEQLGEMDLDKKQQVIANVIVGSIDDRGYLSSTVNQIADDVTFNEGFMVDADQVKEVLDIVKTLDPPGVGASNLQECIVLQLRRKPQTEDVALAITIVDKYFDDMSAQRFDAIARKAGTTPEHVKKVFMDEIRYGVVPSPGNEFSSSYGFNNNQQITPDFEVEVDDENKHVTITLPNKIPALQISKTYTDLYERIKSGKNLSESEKKSKKLYLNGFQRANMIIELLKQRQQTLYSTMEAIVHCQRDYFLSNGDERELKPLGQKQIAEIIGKDLTVVSRAVSNKYVQTPWGIKSLKSFFSEDINGESRNKVYHELRELVDNEDKSHPLSDDALSRKLAEKGYKVSRRTVAKYRRILKIADSGERKRNKL